MALDSIVSTYVVEHPGPAQNGLWNQSNRALGIGPSVLGGALGNVRRTRLSDRHPSASVTSFAALVRDRVKRCSLS